MKRIWHGISVIISGFVVLCAVVFMALHLADSKYAYVAKWVTVIGCIVVCVNLLVIEITKSNRGNKL